jgi:hypothetical protein
MRPALMLALALGLASCGGKAQFTVAGTVSGLKHEGLELSTNGMKIKVDPPAATSTAPVAFAFPDQIEYGQVYSVEISHPPAHQTCSFVGGSNTNTAGRLETINVTIQCVPIANTIGGKVTGLGSKVVLTNGSTGGTIEVLAATPTFTFPAIPYGQTYGVTVYGQPTSPAQTCTVSPNGVGTMDDKAIGDIVVDCLPALAPPVTPPAA